MTFQFLGYNTENVKIKVPKFSLKSKYSTNLFVSDALVTEQQSNVAMLPDTSILSLHHNRAISVIKDASWLDLTQAKR